MVAHHRSREVDLNVETQNGIRATLKSLIEIIIQGKPKALKRHRSTRTGRMYDPSAKDKKQIWLQIAQFKPKRPLVGDSMLK